MSDELDALLSRVHEGLTTFDLDSQQVPCILFDAQKYDSILQRVAGRPVSINTDLNILQDGLGHVFVEILLTFSVGDIVEKVLVDARKSLDFFEMLEKTTIMALSSTSPNAGQGNVFVIQMPQPARISDALQIIRKGLEC